MKMPFCVRRPVSRVRRLECERTKFLIHSTVDTFNASRSRQRILASAPCELGRARSSGFAATCKPHPNPLPRRGNCANIDSTIKTSLFKGGAEGGGFGFSHLTPLLS